jgi:hypothetical protein
MTEIKRKILVAKEDFPVEFLRIVTLNDLTPLEYQVLAALSSYVEIGRREKAKARLKLSIGVYSMNNVIGSLKRKGYLQQHDITKQYTTTVHIPETVSRIIFDVETV